MFAVISLVTAMGLILVEEAGYEFPTIFSFPPLTIWVILLLNLSFTVIPLQVTMQTLAKSASRASASEERYRLITSVMSDYAFFVQFGDDGKVSEQWVSGAFESITGYTPQEHFTRGGWTSILHPDDHGQDQQDMEQLRANKKVISEIRIIRKNGEICWVRAYAHPKWNKNRNSLAGIFGAVKDITNQKNIEISLRQREAVLEIVAHTASLFLKTGNWKTEIDPFLEKLGQTMNASHAYLFENHPLENGELGKSIRNEWSAPSIDSDMNDPAYTNKPINIPELDLWHELMVQKLPYIGDKHHVSKEELKYLRNKGIKALLEVPIYVNDQWWGLIGFDDRSYAREWTVHEVETLIVAANAIGSAIQRQATEDALKYELSERNRVEQALRVSQEKFSKAFHTTQVMMTIEDKNHQFVDVNQAFLDIFDLRLPQGDWSHCIRVEYNL